MGTKQAESFRKCIVKDCIYPPPPFTLMLWNFLYTFDIQSDIRMMLRGNTASPQNLKWGGISLIISEIAFTLSNNPLEIENTLSGSLLG